MTEYDYSPEAHRAFHDKLRGVGKWAQQQAKYSDHYPSPFVPSETSDRDGRNADTSRSLRTGGHRDTRRYDEPPVLHPVYPYSHTIYPGDGRPERAPYSRYHDSYATDTEDSRSRQSGSRSSDSYSRSYSSGSKSRTSSRSSRTSGYETDVYSRSHSHGSDKHSRSSRDTSSRVSYSSGRNAPPVQYVSQPGRPVIVTAGTHQIVIPASDRRRIEVYSHSPISAYSPSRDKKRNEIIVLPASTSGTSYRY